MLRSAIIGLGKIGLGYDINKNKNSFISHANSLFNHPKFKLIAGVDINPSKRFRFKIKFNLNTYKSVNDLLKNEQLDCVVVANNFSNKIKIFEKIARSNSVKFVLFEKPFDIKDNELNKINRLSKKYKVKYAVNFQRSFNKQYLNFINNISFPKKTDKLNITIFYSKNFLSNVSHYLFLLSRFLSRPKNIKVVGNNLIVQLKFSTIQFIKLNGQFSYNHLIIFKNKFKYEITTREEKLKIYKLKKDIDYEGIFIFKKFKEVKISTNKTQKYVLDNIFDNMKGRSKSLFKQNDFKKYLNFLSNIKSYYEKI